MMLSFLSPEERGRERGTDDEGEGGGWRALEQKAAAFHSRGESLLCTPTRNKDRQTQGGGGGERGEGRVVSDNQCIMLATSSARSPRCGERQQGRGEEKAKKEEEEAGDASISLPPPPFSGSTSSAAAVNALPSSMAGLPACLREWRRWLRWPLSLSSLPSDMRSASGGGGGREGGGRKKRKKKVV